MNLARKSILFAAALTLTACASRPDAVALMRAQAMSSQGALADLDRALVEDPRLLHAKNGAGRTLLHVAAESGQVRVMDLLLQKGATLEQRDNQGWTPLHRAVMEKKPASARFLLEKGADPLMKDGNGFSVLLHATIARDAAINAVLAEFGLEPEPVKRNR